jgi:hypothetical protein
VRLSLAQPLAGPAPPAPRQATHTRAVLRLKPGRFGVEADLRRLSVRPAERPGGVELAPAFACHSSSPASHACLAQELESILVGPIPVGLNKIVFQVRAAPFSPRARTSPLRPPRISPRWRLTVCDAAGWADGCAGYQPDRQEGDPR